MTELEKIIDELGAAGQLAMAASIAARVDRAVLRDLRFTLFPRADATAEADLSFSRLVARHSVHELVLATEFLPALRARLLRDGLVDAARNVVKHSHRHASPLVVVEEELIYLGLSGAPIESIERELGKILATLRDQPARAGDIAAWALRALPRLPDLVRTSAPAWSLAFAAAAKAGYSVTLGDAVPDGDILLGPDVPTTRLGVRRTAQTIQLGAVDGAWIDVPATVPRVVTIEAGRVRKVAVIDENSTVEESVPAGEVVLSSLRGERWRVRLQDVADPEPAEADETGLWILVDGTDRFELPLHHDALAQALGRALARAGYSLLTVGGQGVAHVVAKSFWEYLAERDYSSGIYRMAHVVERNRTPDFHEKGRTLPVDGDVHDAAIGRVNAVLLIGASSYSSEIESQAVSRALPVVELVDRTSPHELAPAPPSSWTQQTARVFAADVVKRLGDRFETRPAPPLPLFAAAARALDEQDLVRYNVRLEHVRDLAAAERGFDSTVLVDPRPARRLAGYVRRQAPEPPTLCKALLAERATAVMFREARPLWLALDRVRDVVAGLSQSEARELSAACVSIESELARDTAIDTGGDCAAVLRDILDRPAAGRRARKLGALAANYEDVRAIARGGRSETVKLDALVDEVAKSYRTTGANGEASVWYSSGREGQCIVALALLVGSPDPNALGILLRAIQRPASPFERYTAMRASEGVVDQLDEQGKRELREVLVAARASLAGDRPTLGLCERIISDIDVAAKSAPPRRVWIHNTTASSRGADLQIVGSPEIARGDLVMVFVTEPELHPDGLYEVTAGRRLARTDESGTAATGATATCRCVLTFPPAGRAQLARAARDLRAVSNTTSQRDTRNMRIHDRLIEMLEALYVDDAKTLETIHALLGTVERKMASR